MPVESIAAIRRRVGAVLRDELRTGRRRTLILLAVDGIPAALAKAYWPAATITDFRSVFPATSSTAWLSSLTGAEVDFHGIPGVIFAADDHTYPPDLLNIFEHRKTLRVPDTGHLFADARSCGYEPVAIVGDLEPLDCTWREILLAEAHRVTGYPFYAAATPLSPATLCDRLRSALRKAQESAGAPQLIWCFIDADRHIHGHGYDDELLAFLGELDALAALLAEQDLLVFAYSDHGLVLTRHNPALEELLLHRLPGEFGYMMGGAGRTRWLYCRPGTQDALAAALAETLPGSIRIELSDARFAIGSAAYRRVGELLLIAEGDEFLALPGYTHDHGSLTAPEMEIPLARWGHDA